MKLNRGDVVVARFPHASGFRGKKRPALVVQADVYNGACGAFDRGSNHVKSCADQRPGFRSH